MVTCLYVKPNDTVYAGKLVLHDQFRHIISFLHYRNDGHYSTKKGSNRGVESV